jgi:hypothetical protein
MIAEMMYHAFFDFIREIVFQVGNLRTRGLEKLSWLPKTACSSVRHVRVATVNLQYRLTESLSKKSNAGMAPGVAALNRKQPLLRSFHENHIH